MMVQACINGARPADYHPALPLTAEQMANDAKQCVIVGAAEIHLHIRDRNLTETLSAAEVDRTIALVRSACPGTLLGISTHEEIENDASRTLSCIRQWRVLPNYASVNLSEASALAVMKQLTDCHIGIEAGLGSVADAERLCASGYLSRVFRILIEIEQQDTAEALAIVAGIERVLLNAGNYRPLLLHGYDATIWPLIALAREKGYSTRVGLEDGERLPDGDRAGNNAALVSAALACPAYPYRS